MAVKVIINPPFQDPEGKYESLFSYIYNLDINQDHSFMKKLLLLTIASCICLSLLAQHNPVQWHFEAGGPPAGEFWDEPPFVPGQNYPALRELDFDSLQMNFTGNWPFGQSLSVSSSSTGDTVFFGSGAGLLIVDASDPYDPVVLSEVRARALIDHSYYDASSGLLFLAAYFSGVEIWDLNDILNPQRLSRIPLNSYPRGGIFSRDGFLYIVTVADGLYIADISDPANPDFISHQLISGSLVWTSSFDGDYAYLSQGSSGMKIVDISDPYNPSIEGVFSSNVTGLQVIDGICYMLSNDYGMCIFDFTDLQNISEISCIPIEGNPVRLTVTDSFVYIANSTTNTGGGINTVDISDPENPVLLSTIDPAETYISGSGNVIAASGNSSGFLLLDISNPAEPQYASELNTAWSTVDIAAEGEYAYIGSNGFRVFDMSNPSYPEQVGFDDTQGAIIKVSDTIAVYIPRSMGSGNRVNTMDISDPENPEQVGYYAPPAMTYDLVLKNNYAYVACWWDGFRVVDFSNPESPLMVSHDHGWVSGAVPGEEWCYTQALDIYENYLYVLDWGPFENEDTKGVYIWDISQPDDPVLLNRFDACLSKGYDLKAWGDFVYISDKEGGLEIINVADPMSPFTAGYLSLPDVGWGMDLSWPYAYVSQYILGGVHIVDVSDPFGPEIAGYYQRSGCFALGVSYWDNYALVADGPAGMQVYDFLLATDIEAYEPSNSNDILVYPNPANNKVQIRYHSEQNDVLNISIYDISGRCVYTESSVAVERGMFSRELNISNIPTGMYFIRINSEGSSTSSKILIN